MPQYIVHAANLPSDPFLRGYLECAEWCGLDDSGAWCPECEEFRDGVSDVECPECSEPIYSERIAFDEAWAPEWSAESLERARVDCEAFVAENAGDLEGEDMAQAGHDFYLTRNRHGAGFWDRGLGDVGRRLTEAAHSYGETHESFNHETETLETI